MSKQTKPLVTPRRRRFCEAYEGGIESGGFYMLCDRHNSRRNRRGHLFAHAKFSFHESVEEFRARFGSEAMECAAKACIRYFQMNPGWSRRALLKAFAASRGIRLRKLSHAVKQQERRSLALVVWRAA